MRRWSDRRLQFAGIEIVWPFGNYFCHTSFILHLFRIHDKLSCLKFNLKFRNELLQTDLSVIFLKNISLLQIIAFVVILKFIILSELFNV